MNLEKIKRLLGLAYRSKNVYLGEYSILKEIKKNKVKLLIFSNDISEKSKFRIMCTINNKNISYETIPMKKNDLGEIFGKKITTCLAVTNKDFADGIMKYIRG